MDKMALMQRLKLDDLDKIKLLIHGINNFSIKCAAATLRVSSLNQFIREVHGIIESCGDSNKRFQYPNTKLDKLKDSTSKTGKSNASNYTGNEDSHSNSTKAQTYCVYCHNKDHDRDNCPKLKRKQQQDARSKQQQDVKPKQQLNQSAPVATIENVQDQSTLTMACVQDLSKKLVISNPLIEVNEISGKICSLYALIDTGSPISFINALAFSKLNFASISLKKSMRSYKALNNYPIAIQGYFSTSVKLKALPNLLTPIDLHVLRDNASSADMIFGRDFLAEHEISVLIKKDKNETDNKIKLFSEIASAEVIDDSLKDYLSDLEIDFNPSVKKELIDTILAESIPVSISQDDYCVKVTLKDDSIYAYSPRRFAYTERIKIREITDDLLQKGIIRHSSSPYCARVVPIRKKNGSMRLSGLFIDAKNQRQMGI